MNELQLLQDARAVIADPRNWTQGYFHRVVVEKTATTAGIPLLTRKTVIEEKMHHTYCMVGAISAAGGMVTSLHHRVYSLLSDAIKKEYPFLSTFVEKVGTSGDLHIPSFNDNVSVNHEKVLRVFDRAIEDLKQKEYEKKRNALYQSVGELTAGAPIPPLKEEHGIETVRDKVLSEV